MTIRQGIATIEAENDPYRLVDGIAGSGHAGVSDPSLWRHITPVIGQRGKHDV